MLRALRPVLLLFGIPAALIALALAFFELFLSSPSLTYRYRLTIEINTPHGVKSASSVIETRLVNNHDAQWALPAARRFTAHTRGDAVFVDLGDGHHIIALIAMGPTARDDLAFRRIVPLSLEVRWDDPKQTIPAVQNAMERAAEIELSEQLVPTLVIFRDLTDAHSAIVISIDQIPDVFGAGYAFRRATIKVLSPGWWPLNVVGLSGTSVTSTIHKQIPTIFKVLERERFNPILGYPGQPYTRLYGQFRKP